MATGLLLQHLGRDGADANAGRNGAGGPAEEGRLMLQRRARRRHRPRNLTATAPPSSGPVVLSLLAGANNRWGDAQQDGLLLKGSLFCRVDLFSLLLKRSICRSEPIHCWRQS
jgi:hypothetical protein